MPKLHPKQQEVFDSDARFRTISAGRRGGKTAIGVLLAVVEGVNGGRVWWVAPTYSIASPAWRELKKLVRDVPGVIIREGDKMILFEGTGTKDGFIQMKSADDPNKLRGDGLDLIICDEFAHQKRAKALWEQSLRPALAEREGKAVFISTPYGKNYFYELYTWGELDEDTGEPLVPGWKSFTWTSAANIFFPALVKDSEEARLTSPLEVFEQEYLALFNDSAGQVFRNVKNCVYKDIHSAPDSDKTYVIGVDWAKLKDFTVFTVIDKDTKTIVRLDRFNKIDYKFQLRRLEILCNLYNPEFVVIERNAAGEVIVELLREQLDYKLIDFFTTLQSKARIIEDLALAFEGGEITIPDNDTLLNELESFRGKRSKTGIMSYSAPSHLHDDMVMSLAIAWYGMKEDKPVAQATVRPNPLYGGGAIKRMTWDFV